MKTLLQRYTETKAELERLKPRSERRAIVQSRLVALMTRRLRAGKRAK